ncbi:hypothetical protein ACFQU3_19600 [Terrabacter sp. GCM10028922]|uniref:hypothetical protein n=1 Tax=Terrabacter sp. GCM10028922 TaxID=3273428 RepID=UPI00361D6C02
MAFQFAYVAFVGVVILAPLQLLGHFAQRKHLVRPFAVLAHRPVLLVTASLVAGLCLAWVAVGRANSPTGFGFWLGPLIASAVALLLVARSTWRPLRASGMPFAAGVVAVAIASKYVVLGAQPFTGSTPDQTFEAAVRVSGWAWVVLLGGVLWLIGRERGLTSGGLLLLLALAAEVLWRTVHVGLGATKVTAAVLILIAVGSSGILLGSRLGWPATEPKRRILVAFARAAALAIGAAAIGEIAPAALETALYGAGVVLASLGVLLFRQPGRGLAVPERGAVYLQAAAAALLLVTAQALLASTPLGVTIALGAEREVADLMVLPLLVVLASFTHRTTAHV